MKQTKLRVIAVSLSLALLALPLAAAHGAGGRIEGKVANPQGAVIVGAVITVTGADGAEAATGITDGDGHYKIEGLKAGIYTVTISAKGFSNARNESVKVAEGEVATLDARLEIAPILSSVNVNAL